MRVTALVLVSATLSLVCACKTSRASRSAEAKLESLENEDQLPACDDITLGRSYWVRSLNQQMSCAEGGAWLPRDLDGTGQLEIGTGPRGIP